jgi:hypothetical protein
MRVEQLRLVCALGAGSSLLYLYLTLIRSLASLQLAAPQTAIEAAVFTSLLLRVLVITAIPRLRASPPELVFIMLSLENLLLPPLALLYILTANRGYISLIMEIFFSWPSASIILVPPYAFWRLARGIHRGGPLASILPSASLQWGSILLIAELVQRSAPPSPGLTGLTRVMLAAVRGNLSGAALLASDPIVKSASLVIYLAILTATVASLSGGAGGQLNRLLLLPLAGTTLTLLPVGTSIIQGIDLFFTITLPTITITTIIWGLTREG